MPTCVSWVVWGRYSRWWPALSLTPLWQHHMQQSCLIPWQRICFLPLPFACTHWWEGAAHRELLPADAIEGVCRGFVLNAQMLGPAEHLFPEGERDHWKTKCRHPQKNDAHARKEHCNPPTPPPPRCSNSWVRKVQLNYVNAEMNVLCRTSTGDTCPDCSDISSSKRLCCISFGCFER